MDKRLNVNFRRLATWLMPPILRGSFFVEWVNILIVPVKAIYNDFKRYVEEQAYWLGITPQVCYLEKALNDTFDKEFRRITITDTTDYLVILIHKAEAQKPLMTHKANTGNDEDIPIIHHSSAYADSGYDFNVNIPFLLTQPEEFRLRSILDKFKLASKQYRINYT